MSDAPTKSAPRTSGSGDDAGSGAGGPHGNIPEATITTPARGDSKPLTRPGDRIFSSLASGSAVLISVIIAAIAVSSGVPASSIRLASIQHSSFNTPVWGYVDRVVSSANNGRA